MSMSSILPELFATILSYLSDPCDLFSLLITSHYHHALTWPTFTRRFSHLEGGVVGIRDYRAANLSTNSLTTDRTTLTHLAHCNLAFIALENGWMRLFKHLTANRGVPGANTVLFDEQGINQRSLLVEAVFRNNREAVQHLLSVCGTFPDECLGTDLDHDQDVEAETTTALCAAALSDNAALAAMLLGHGASPTYYDPIVDALNESSADVLELLLEAGVPAYCHSSEPKLHSACWMPKDARCAKLLVDAGHPLGVWYGGETELSSFVMGFVVMVPNIGGRRRVMTSGEKETLAYLLEKGRESGVSVDELWVPQEGPTPLHEAAMGGNHEMCEMLLNAGMKCSAGNFQRSPATIAEDNGYNDLAMMLDEAAARE